MTIEMNEEIKAKLISIGSADIPDSILGRTTTPSAGPGAGSTSFFISSGGHRVRLTINRNSPLKVEKYNDGVVVLLNGEPVVHGQLEDALSHCPEQAYITLTESCIYDCKFCPVPVRNGPRKSIEEILELVEEAKNIGNMKAIAITSGVLESPEEEVDYTLKVINALKAIGYKVPIGVSVYPTKNSSELLKEAGVKEIKYNVETMDREIFKNVCEGLSLDFILKSLEHAVQVFGKNRVFSNFIIGLGESDETVKEGVEKLASMGVIPVLRAIGVHPLRKGVIEANRPSQERLLKLAKMHREILDRYGLRADVSETMCLPCTGCDMTPHHDV